MHCITHTCNRFLAAGTEGASGGMVVELTVRLSLVLEIVSSWKSHLAHLQKLKKLVWSWRRCFSLCYLAREALWVPLGIESCNKAFHDGLAAALTARGVVLVVTLATVRLAVLFMETVRTKLPPAERAEEMLRMPRLVQSPHHLLYERERERRGGGVTNHNMWESQTPLISDNWL